MPGRLRPPGPRRPQPVHGPAAPRQQTSLSPLPMPRPQLPRRRRIERFCGQRQAGGCRRADGWGRQRCGTSRWRTPLVGRPGPGSRRPGLRRATHPQQLWGLRCLPAAAQEAGLRLWLLCHGRRPQPHPTGSPSPGHHCLCRVGRCPWGHRPRPRRQQRQHVLPSLAEGTLPRADGRQAKARGWPPRLPTPPRPQGPRPCPPPRGGPLPMPPTVALRAAGPPAAPAAAAAAGQGMGRRPRGLLAAAAAGATQRRPPPPAAPSAAAAAQGARRRRRRPWQA